MGKPITDDEAEAVRLRLRQLQLVNNNGPGVIVRPRSDHFEVPYQLMIDLLDTAEEYL